MTIQARVVGAVLVVAMIVVAWTIATASAQKPATWIIGSVVRTVVGVIDAGDVCIYVSNGHFAGGIFVLPKSALPRERCQ